MELYLLSASPFTILHKYSNTIWLALSISLTNILVQGLVILCLELLQSSLWSSFVALRPPHPYPDHTAQTIFLIASVLASCPLLHQIQTSHPYNQNPSWTCSFSLTAFTSLYRPVCDLYSICSTIFSHTNFCSSFSDFLCPFSSGATLLEYTLWTLFFFLRIPPFAQSHWHANRV